MRGDHFTIQIHTNTYKYHTNTYKYIQIPYKYHINTIYYHILYIVIHSYTIYDHHFTGLFHPSIASGGSSKFSPEPPPHLGGSPRGSDGWSGCTCGRVSHGLSPIAGWFHGENPSNQWHNGWFFGTGLDTYELSVRPWDLAHVEHCLTNTNIVLRFFKMFEGSN